MSDICVRDNCGLNTAKVNSSYRTSLRPQIVSSHTASTILAGLTGTLDFPGDLAVALNGGVYK